MFKNRGNNHESQAITATEAWLLFQIIFLYQNFYIIFIYLSPG